MAQLTNDDAARRARRVYHVHAVRVPIMRTAGIASMLVALAVSGAAPDRLLIPLILGLAIYAAAAWLLVRAYYRHPENERRMGLQWFLHAIDIAGCSLVVYLSGGSESWLFFFLLIPVMNQTYVSAAFAIISGACATALYGAMLLWIRFVDGEAVDWRSAALKMFLMLLFAAYCTGMGAIAERDRKRVAEKLRRTKAAVEARAADLAALNRITQTAASSADLETVLRTVAREMVELFRASRCYVALVDDRRDVLRVAAALPSADIVGLEIPLADKTAAAYVVWHGRPLVVPDAQQNALTAPMHPLLRRLGVQCLMLAPLLSYGDVIGVIVLDTDDAARVFSVDEVALAQTMAGAIAGPVGNARLFVEEKRSRELAERLHATAAAVSRSVDLPTVLAEILRQLQEVVPFDGGAIEVDSGVIARHGDSSMGETLDVPLVVRDQTIGTMSIRRSGSFEAREGDVATAFAQHAAIAIDNARLYQSLAEMAVRDPLTSIANRRRFEETLAAEWRRASRALTPLAVVMIDVDFFKGYNDTHGHQQGDEVLRAVSAALASAVARGGDLVARFGGEEFVALLPETDAWHAAAVAERLRHRVASLAIPHGGSSTHNVTISLGVAAAVPVEGMNTSELIGAADQALYAAKRGGRNRVEVAPAMAVAE